VSFRRIKSKLPKNTSRHPKQPPLHVPRSVNRFEPLSNLQDDAHQSTPDQHSLQPRLVKFNAKKRRKVILLGDSHIRGCSEILGDLLGTSFSVIGITKQNANMKAVTNSINLKAEKLSRRDVVLLCCGTRDVAKNEINNGLR